MFSSTLTVLLLAASSVLAADHVVMVGKDASGAAKLVYTPESVTAAVGDSVTFTFPGTTHTATLSSFAAPCKAVADATAFNVGGTPGTYSFNVTDTKPSWFYCKTGTHCQSGMVFAINPTADKTFAAFQATAMGASSGTSSNTTSTSPTGQRSAAPSASASSKASSTPAASSTGAAGRAFEVASSAAIMGAFLSVVAAGL